MENVVALVDALESKVHFKAACIRLEASTGFPDYTIIQRLDQIETILDDVQRIQHLCHQALSAKKAS